MIFITYNNHRYIKINKFCRRLCIKHVYFCAFFLVFLHLLLLLLSPFIYKFLLLPVLPVGGVVCNLHFYCSCLVIPYCLLVVRAFLQTHLTGCICLACKMCLLLSILLLLLSWSLFFICTISQLLVFFFPDWTQMLVSDAWYLKMMRDLV